MAQLRQGYKGFTDRGAEVVVVGPEGREAFADYWEKHDLPFIGLPDPKHSVLKLYGQEVKIFKFGRMPAQVVVDGDGQVRYVHYGHSMGDIPSNAEIWGILDTMGP
ncbi:MAG: redoxin domain-containing protein [Gemmatimonadota bacterium]|jgi:peroxiredoxin Q/BCP